MPSYSQATISGHLVRDPSTKEFHSSSVTEFTVAVNDKRGDREETMFLDCKFWGDRGKTFAQWHNKGDAVLVGGKLKQENWETQDGSKRSKIVLNVFDFTFVKAKDTDPASASTAPQPARVGYQTGGSDVDMDDLPF